MTARNGPTTRPSLLIRIHDSNDSESWSLFEQVYGPVIRSYCRVRGIQSNDIDDIAQEVLTSVARAIRNFEYQPAKGKFRSWLAAITANKLRTFISKKGKRSGSQLELIEKMAVAPNSDNEWKSIFVKEVLQVALQRIRPHFEERTWACFEETWTHHRSAVSVADELGIKIQAVYVNKSRVLNRLEEEFKELTDDLPISDIHGNSGTD